ncbi:MAG: hypothetical protein ACFE95_19565 [Candidatus Hodarchaeota archaeon]
MIPQKDDAFRIVKEHSPKQTEDPSFLDGLLIWLETSPDKLLVYRSIITFTVLFISAHYFLYLNPVTSPILLTLLFSNSLAFFFLIVYYALPIIPFSFLVGILGKPRETNSTIAQILYIIAIGIFDLIGFLGFFYQRPILIAGSFYPSVYSVLAVFSFLYVNPLHLIVMMIFNICFYELGWFTRKFFEKMYKHESNEDFFLSLI